jgi:hypothetical protein
MDYLTLCEELDKQEVINKNMINSEIKYTKDIYVL